jgi:hypothetical protein
MSPTSRPIGNGEKVVMRYHLSTRTQSVARRPLGAPHTSARPRSAHPAEPPRRQSPTKARPQMHSMAAPAGDAAASHRLVRVPVGRDAADLSGTAAAPDEAVSYKGSVPG